MVAAECASVECLSPSVGEEVIGTEMGDEIVFSIAEMLALRAVSAFLTHNRMTSGSRCDGRTERLETVGGV